MPRILAYYSFMFFFYKMLLSLSTKIKEKDSDISFPIKPGLVNRRIINIVPKLIVSSTLTNNPKPIIIPKKIIKIVPKVPCLDSLMKDLYGKNTTLTISKANYSLTSQILQIIDNPNSTHARNIYFALMDKFPIVARKCSLISIIKKKQGISVFNDFTLTMKKMAINAYQLLNLHLQRVISLDLPVPNLSDQLIYSNICRIVSTNQLNKVDFSFVKDEDLKRTGEIYHSLLPNDYKLANRFCLNNFTNTLVRQIQTATINHLNLNLIGRLDHYLKLKFGITSESHRKNICLKILYKNTYPSKFDKNFQTLLILRILKNYRLNLNQNQKPVDNYQQLLQLYSFLQKEFEILRTSGFSLLPLSAGFIPDYLDLTSSLLPEFFRFLPEKEKRQKDAEYKLISSVEKWCYFFNLSSLPECNGEFAFNISSDGVGCTVLFNELPKVFEWKTFKELSFKQRSLMLLDYLQNHRFVKEPKSDEFSSSIQETELFLKDEESEIGEEKKVETPCCPFKFQDYKYYYGNDPGTRYFFTIDVAIADNLSDTGYKESFDKTRIRCSKAEYKKITGIREYQQWLNKKKIPELKVLSDNSLHVYGYQKLEKNLKNVLEVTQKLLDEYSDPEYRIKRFDQFKKKLLAFDYMKDKILDGKDGKDGKDIIIGWGNGGTSQKGVKGSHLPHKEFFSFLNRTTKMTFHDINEHNTSKKCSICGCDVEKLKIDPEEHLEYISKNAKTEKAKEKLKKLLSLQKEREKAREEKEKRTGKKTFWKKGHQEIYAITRCKNNECRITWERDVNSSKNILRVLLNELKGLERPKFLQRKKKAVNDEISEVEIKVPIIVPPMLPMSEMRKPTLITKTNHVKETKLLSLIDAPEGTYSGLGKLIGRKY